MAEKILGETLEDSEQIDLLLERLKYLDEQFRALGSVEPTPPELNNEFFETASGLAELLRYKDISVSGRMRTPAVDAHGNIVGAINVTGSVEACRLEHINVITKDRGTGFPPGAIVLQFISGSVIQDSDVGRAAIDYRVTFPVSECTLHCIDDLDTMLDSIEPEADDQIAQEIDIALLNESINLDALAELVATKFPLLSELQRDMYLNYIQRVGSIGDCDVAVRANEVTLYGVDKADTEAIVLDEPVDIAGTFNGYAIDQVEGSDGQEHFLLGMLIYSEEYRSVVLVRMQDITDILFVRQTAVHDLVNR